MLTFLELKFLESDPEKHQYPYAYLNTVNLDFTHQAVIDKICSVNTYLVHVLNQAAHAFKSSESVPRKTLEVLNSLVQKLEVQF